MSTYLFQRNAQLGSARLALMFGAVFLLQFKRFFQPSAALLYTQESRDFDPNDPEKPLWSNLGYWKHARTLADACADMAGKLAAAADLQASDRLLDVGCGCAEQDIYWVTEYDVGKIIGLEITPLRVELANSRIRNSGLGDRIEVRQGTATECPFDDASFDKITALECAFHFDTREHFFAEAMRLLKPGGRLATADILPSTNSSHTLVQGWLRKIGRRYSYIPDVNMYDQREYARKLEQAGFVDVSIESIGDYVFPGVAKQQLARPEKSNSTATEIELEAEDFVAADWLCAWRDLAGLEDYVIVAATKPAENPANGKNSS